MRLELDINTRSCSDYPGLFSNLWDLPSLAFLECRFTDLDHRVECVVMSPVFLKRRGIDESGRREIMQLITETIASRLRDRELFPAHTEFTSQHDFSAPPTTP